VKENAFVFPLKLCKDRLLMMMSEVVCAVSVAGLMLQKEHPEGIDVTFSA